MRPIRSALTLVLLVVGLAACGGGGGDDAGWPAQTTAAIDTAVRARMAAQALPGVVVLVSMPGRGDHVAAYGEADVGTHLPRRADDPFRIASITKTFIATVVLQLVDEGRVALTDTVSRWYPDFPNGRTITLDHLLRMRSGIADSADAAFLAEYYADPLLALTADDMIERAAARGHAFTAPGQQTRYVNVNFMLLERIAEKVTGQPIDRLLEERIFRPLDMRGSRYPRDSRLDGGNRGYSLDPGRRALVDKTVLNPAPAGGAGAIISTLSDLKTYARALCTGTLLRPETHRRRLQGATIDGAPDFAKYGAGIELIDTFCGHNGTIFGFSTEMYYLPAADAVLVISVNRLDLDDASQSSDLFLALTRLLFPDHVRW